MKRCFLTLFLTLIIAIMQAADPVEWSYNLTGDNTDHPVLKIKAVIGSDYHLYAQENPAGGANPLVFTYTLKGCRLDGKTTAGKAYSIEYNDIFEVDEYYYTGEVEFTQKIIPEQPDYTIDVEINGQACNDTGCIQVFSSRSIKGKAKIANNNSEVKENIEKDVLSLQDKETSNAMDAGSADSIAVKDSELLSEPISGDRLWANVEKELNEYSKEKTAENRSLLYIFIAGFIGGLIALVTPCVWPMIPMTVSFFLKQNKTKRKSITTAMIYGLSILVIYVSLGLIVTAIFGASALNALATSAGFNIAFFLLLVIFAISFMGGFELTLPSSWTNKMDAKVDTTTGYVSIFFMAFTLTLVSFSCTGPIIGTLLVEAAATSNFVSPAIGMAGFALALALPFTIFAMFPTVLKSMPKSGGWMNTVKVVLGFLELALALKFLSVADLAYGWRILDREVFLSLWIVIFALLGVYLLGKITFPHDDKVEKTGVTRFLLACVSFAFAIYMLPGLWGAPLKSISAFSPPMYTQDFSLYDGEVHARTDDFEEAMRLGQRLNKPVLIDFSGYGCVNCRKMEAAVWTDDKVKNTIDDDFILVTLMVDDKTALPEPITVIESNGTERILRTVGDKWSYLQRSKFGASAQPFHVIVDNNGMPLAPAFVYKEDVAAYQKFLNTGKDNYKK